MGEQEQKTETDAEAVERYREIQKEGHHTLPYKEFLRAKELGIELPEADPVFELGTDCRRPVSVAMPKGLPLEGCYRIPTKLIEQTFVIGDNALLLAALGQLEEPFIPVWIPDEYEGYSWTKLPTVESMEMATGRTLHGAPFGGTRGLTCVDSIVLTAHTSDGKVHSGHVCLAAGEPVLWCSGGSQTIYVTPEARTRLRPTQVLPYLGVDSDDAAWAARATVMLDDFWLVCGSDREAIRLAILERLETLVSQWEAITRTRDNVVTIRTRDGSELELRPKR